MLERLANLLAGLATPAQLQSVLEAVTVLGENGFYQFEQIVNDEVALCRDEPSRLTGTLIEQHLIPMMRTYLGTMGIAVGDDLSLPDLTEIFSAVLRVEQFEDQEILFGLATCEEDNADILAGILAVVAAKTDEYFLPKIEMVSDACIARIAELTSTFDDTEHVDLAVYELCRKRVIEFVKLIRNGPLHDVFVNYVDLNTVKLGYDAGMTFEGIRDQFDELPEDAAIILIVLHTLASNAPNDLIKSVAGHEVEMVANAAAEHTVGLAATDLMKTMRMAKRVAGLLAQVGYE